MPNAPGGSLLGMVNTTQSSPAGADSATPEATPLSGLSIVLPCFNEEANVADAIRNAQAAASLTSLDHEIIVVDDGSSDATATVAGRFLDSDPRVRLIVHARNRGYGDAVRSGIDAATQPWVLLTDADLQFDLRDLVDFLPLAPESDIVMGWRVERADPLHRRLLTRFELVSGGAMISTELLVRSLAAGARLSEVGVRHRARVAGEQSGASPRVVVRAFRELTQLRSTLRGLSAPVA
jgi:hypothetical protein